MTTSAQKIAVIGSGVSGLSAAWALSPRHDVKVFEATDRLGGHSHTVAADVGGKTIDVDVGFIVCNPLNYPNFLNFLDCLGVETQPSDMSFSVSDPNAFEWSSDPSGIFAQKRNLFRPRFLKMLKDIFRFNASAQKDAEAGKLPSDLTLGQYLDNLGTSETFRTHYIYPMGAAIWSTPEADMSSYPAKSFIQFFNNHKLLHSDRPKWRTVAGGSQSYVAKLRDYLGSRAVTNSPVLRVNRTRGGLEVLTEAGSEAFDQIILATHTHQAHDILGDGFEHQASILAPMGVTENVAYLHSDTRLMPKRKAAWASWNVIKEGHDKVTLSYWMNRLQTLDTETPVIVTLNPETPPETSKTMGRFEFTHPLFDLSAQTAVEAVKRVNGRDGLWFAGAWMGHGFHEDGLKSGLRVAVSLGAELPWIPVDITPYTVVEYDIEEQPPASVTASK